MNLRKRDAHSALGEPFPVRGTRRVKRSHHPNDNAPWRHPDELDFYSAETHPHYTPASFLADLKRNACTITSDNNYPTIHLQDGSSFRLPVVYRLPLIYISHFLWHSVFLIACRDLYWEDHMFNILHISRLIVALAEHAKRTQPRGAALALWRCPTFDRAAIRMITPGFLLPHTTGGYGDEYLADFWSFTSGLDYTRNIEECNWKPFVLTARDAVAPLEQGDELYQFDADPYVECLRCNGNGVVIWDPPETRAARKLMERLTAKYPAFFVSTPAPSSSASTPETPEEQQMEQTPEEQTQETPEEQMQETPEEQMEGGLMNDMSLADTPEEQHMVATLEEPDSSRATTPEDQLTDDALGGSCDAPGGSRDKPGSPRSDTPEDSESSDGGLDDESTRATQTRSVRSLRCRLPMRGGPHNKSLPPPRLYRPYASGLRRAIVRPRTKPSPLTCLLTGDILLT